MAKRKKVLITGSGGFIFGNFIRRVFLEKLPYVISSIDRVRDSQIHNIYVNSDHSFHIADVRDSHTLHVIFEKEKPDVVIHGASEFKDHIDHFSKQLDSMVENNIVGTQNIIKECLRTDARMIFVSSSRVYGDLLSEDAQPYDENSAYNPNSTYAASKAAGELFVKAKKDLKYNIVRLSDCYGPWQTRDNFIPHIINSIFESQDIIINGPGYQSRDWTHVFDICSAIFSVIDNGVNKETYNITSRQEFSHIEVAQIICNTLEKGHELINHVEKDFDVRYSMSNEKIKELGWIPQFKFRDGIIQACQWYLNNKYFLRM